MNSFINSLIDRSTAPIASIQPRLRGKFERAAAPLETLSANDEFASNTERSLQHASETVISQKTERIRIAKLVQERSEEIPSTAPRLSQKNQEQLLPDVKPERPPRFEPSYNLVAPGQSAEQGSPEKNITNITNVYQQSPQSGERSSSSDSKNKPQQESLHQPQVSSTPAIVTKEVYKPLSVVKPIANNSLRVESPYKTQPKQSPVAFFIRKQAPPPASSRTINISIGRIEVCVSQPPAPLTVQPKKESIAIMGLDEYLQKRNQRGK